MGLQGIVSKRRDRIYRAGRSPDWIRSRIRSRQQWSAPRCLVPGDWLDGIGLDHRVPWGAPCVIELNLHANATTTPKVRPTSSAASMTLVIQRAEHRDTEAIHAKLDELLQAHSAANNKVMRIDDKDAEEVERAGSQSLVATVQIVDAPIR